MRSSAIGFDVHTLVYKRYGMAIFLYSVRRANCMADLQPERQSGGATRCPKCRKQSLQHIEATGEVVCTNCGYKQIITRK
jgi:DNA-directed RNA polymerase subunit RPC12/RpoP